MRQISIETSSRTDVVEVTGKVNSLVSDLEVASGVNLWVPHTTAGITVNESADPAVMRDVTSHLDDLVPWDKTDFRHAEGNSAAHIKSVTVGCRQWLPVSGGGLDLGRWQGVFFLEFDGPRTRKLRIYGD